MLKPLPPSQKQVSTFQFNPYYEMENFSTPLSRVKLSFSVRWGPKISVHFPILPLLWDGEFPYSNKGKIVIYTEVGSFVFFGGRGVSNEPKSRLKLYLKRELTCISNIPITLRSTKNFLRWVAMSSTALCTPVVSPCISTTLSSGRAKTGRFSAESHQ